MQETNFKSGFAVMAGLPNAGKSTLLNAFAGGLLSAISPKPQTTRQNILAVSEGENYQIIFVDTPGFLEAKYKLQHTMSNALRQAVDEDADIILFVFDPTQNYSLHTKVINKIKDAACPILLVINKIDTQTKEALAEFEEKIKKDLPAVKQTFFISAKKAEGVTELKNTVVDLLPNNPPYFPEGQWTDRWERFYVAEFIREQIFMLYDKEVPYSTYVEVEKFTEDLGDKNFIHAKIYVERESQKPIIIGKGGKAIGELRKAAQARIQEFLGRKYRLELEVDVAEGWRENGKMLKKFGYTD
ncbi:GTP-binding protein Era [Elusimicrobium simillimum]|uniref:GTPase Era n=1 Tax=Elusimicrobium simillimum TaxID=3143438 RepID=UPI003C703469